MTLEERVAQLEKELAELKLAFSTRPLTNELAYLEVMKHRAAKIISDSAKRQEVLAAFEAQYCSAQSLLQQLLE